MTVGEVWGDRKRQLQRWTEGRGDRYRGGQSERDIAQK